MRTPRHPAEDRFWSDGALREALQASAAAGRLSDEDIRAMRASRRRRIASASTAALLILVGAGSWQHWSSLTHGTAPELHFATRAGETRVVQLADGSSLHLSGATSVDVTLGMDRRAARLSAGEAYFDVAHDPARPFTVQAGATNVRVLGTAFDVDLTSDQVGLAVYRGAVRFEATHANAGVVVKAGYRMRYRRGHTDAPTPFEAKQPGWLSGWLDTNGMRLGDLVEVLNRQAGASITPPPPALAAMSVSGRFRLDNSEQLLTAIGSVDGFTVRHEGNHLAIAPAS